MITRDIGKFSDFARNAPTDFGPATAKAAFLIAPEGFSLAEQSASDNLYMDLRVSVDPQLALQQHRELHRALSQSLPTICFPGNEKTPDAQFPNNVFATARGKLILGHMRHPVRQAEVDRADIRGFFRDVLRYEEVDLRKQSGICELTGSLVIDHRRGLGFCGLSERCDATGAAAMHEAFGLRATLMFDLAPHEYHSNVVLSILAGRAAVIADDGFADPAVAQAIAELYPRQALRLSDAEKTAFAGNCLALSEDTVWMSQAGARALSPSNRAILASAGFTLQSVDMSEIEKAGGSLRCCVAEVY
ncbi:MAG: amidinotransferase [Gammaproteobacteria bacterium RIFCSPHIGHO2_12_FULL_63_22]|nr:MAG: amidinotransferase [Gammaproteobacteria bacterium RIFCSPHIGHO2_12_FULL_63_22]